MLIPLLLATSMLPTVDQVEAHFISALGGASAITRPHSMTTRGQNIIFGARSKHVMVDYVIYMSDFKRLEIDDVADRGRYRSGFDGTTGWSVDPNAKPQIVTGSMNQSVRRDADLYYFAHIPKYFRSMSVVDIETFGGQRCYHVRGTTLWGNENNQYYAVDTGLLMGYRFHQWLGTAPDKAESVQLFDQYRNFDGLMISTRERDFRNGIQVGVGHVTSVTFNDVDPRVFTPPASVRALLPNATL